MCGIVGYVGAREAAPVLLDGLSRLEYRGYDSAGIAVQDEALPQIHIVKTAGRVKRLTEMTDGGRAAPGRCGVGHTRWATHGEASARNAHPHASPDGRVALVHNGVIGNHRAIREQLLARGARFASDTDTEAAALLLHALYAGQDARAGDNARAIGAIGEMMRVLEGSYALAIL